MPSGLPDRPSMNPVVDRVRANLKGHPYAQHRDANSASCILDRETRRGHVLNYLLHRQPHDQRLDWLTCFSVTGSCPVLNFSVHAVSRTDPSDLPCSAVPVADARLRPGTARCRVRLH
ncbi:hypothetical protein SAMN05216274_10562 [Cryobacterium levicorallinum]|uniref:Uncharacterized protein n=1 Tax=Cryobacterium levicorallinum TaxID=995038 RepID=A0ABY1ECE3_9MICO|nr:hypothetical protein SAMN05216274_10562 [Cryobacterium levicorallinum]